MTIISALILEEIALDSDSTETKNNLLKEAESLHLKSLKLSKNAIGEKCITTSNHYGNLGRLYQSMKKPKVIQYFFIGKRLSLFLMTVNQV